MNYLALDQSIINTGYAIYNNETNEIKIGTIRTKKGKGEREDIRRVREIYEKVQEIIDINNIDIVIMEKVYIQRTTSAIILSKLEFVLKYELDKKEKEIRSISANPRHKESWPRLIGFEEAKPKEFYEKIEILTREIGKANTHEIDAIGLLIAGTKLDKKCEKQEIDIVQLDKVKIKRDT